MWFKHPKYLSAKSCFIQEVEVSDLANLAHHLPKILFICGGDPKYCSNRAIMETYLTKHEPKFLFFRAEYAWAAISEKGKEFEKPNALALEEWLADFSDAVIILVESFGTVAELGAFSISPPLRKKLLPIISKEYEKDESFINTGPVMWVDSESSIGPTIYADFSTILTCMPMVASQLNQKNTYQSRSSDNKLFGSTTFSRKEFLFYLLHTITALGPLSEKEIIDLIVKTIAYGKSTKESKEISFVLSLCIALGMVQTIKIDDLILFACLDYKEFYRDETTKRALSLSQHLRARCLSDLVYIPEYSLVLKRMINDVAK